MEELVGLYEVDEGLAEPAPETITLFDDLLRSGAHFKAAQRVLAGRFPGVAMVGVFLARVVAPRQ